MKAIAFAAAALAILAGCASAETFVPLPVLGSTVLDFDTDAGKYSGWEVADLGSVNAVRLTVQVHRLGQDPRWAPTFNVRVSNGDHWAALRLESLDRQAPVAVVLASGEKDKPAVEAPLSAPLALDTPLEVAIDWTADGKVTIRAGAQAKTVDLGGAPKSLSFTGSTGEIEFNPLKIGRVTP